MFREELLHAGHEILIVRGANEAVALVKVTPTRSLNRWNGRLAIRQGIVVLRA